MNTTESKYYLLGQAVRMRLMEMREPVAYLYAYGGIVAPKLPKSEHPYAYIGSSGISTKIYYLCFTDILQTASNVSKIIHMDEGETYQLVDGEWVEGPGSGGAAAVWSNTDIYYNNDVTDIVGVNIGGTLCLAATKPVPTDNDMMVYTSMVLPALPKLPYPYALIFKSKGYNTVHCVATPEPLIITVVYCQGGGATGVTKAFTKSAEGSEWDGFSESTNPVLGTSFYEFSWANYDVYDNEGRLRVKSSDPVPVYE